MYSSLERTVEVYRTLTRGSPEEDPSDIGWSERGACVLPALLEKAKVREAGTVFVEAPPEESAEGPEEVPVGDIFGGSGELEPADRIYVGSYPVDEEGERIGEEPNSVYTMYVDSDTEVPVCTCPEMQMGGSICHHMILHALRRHGDPS